MTERLYYADSSLREFAARVLERSADGRTVYLDRTLFYPASGGQPFDVGSIAGVAVVEVVDEEEPPSRRRESKETMRFFEAFANIFRVPDLRKRLLFTLGLLAVYRLGGHTPAPGINPQRWQEFMNSSNGSLFSFFDMFAGGNIRRFTVFALGIMPYITASIILQLLTVVVPTLEKLQKEGELGRRKITQWTRYLTIVLSVVQSATIAAGLQSAQLGIVINPGMGFVLLTIISLTTGTAFIMWLGEQISERGVGNGMSLIIFTGIVVGLPHAMQNVYQNTFVTHEWNAFELIAIIAMMIVVVAFIVLVERGERRIPVQYAKRVVGRRVMGGQSTHMPLKVNAGGVIPVIFASSILAFPTTLMQ